MITRILTKLNFIFPQFTETNSFNLTGYNRSRYFSKHCLQNFLIRKFLNSESADLFLDYEPFYRTGIPLFSISISAKQQLKPKI